MAEADKICFLFGAGAEVGFDIAGGGDFAKDVLGISDEGKAMTDAIAEYYKKGRSCLVGTETDGWYPVYTRQGWKSNEIKKAAVMTKFLFEKSDEITDSKKNFETIIKREVKNAKDSEIKKYLSYKGLIDANFYTMIAPKYLGPTKFWQVVNTLRNLIKDMAVMFIYWTGHCTLMSPLPISMKGMSLMR